MKNFEIPYQKLEVPESCSTLHIMVAECFKKIEFWYPRFGFQKKTPMDKKANDGLIFKL